MNHCYQFFYIYIYIYIYIYTPIPPHEQDRTQYQFLNRIWQVWTQRCLSSRSVAIPRLKSPVCPTILSIASERIVGFMPSSKGISAMWNAHSSRIWTWVIISYNSNHYTTGTLTNVYIYIDFCMPIGFFPYVRRYITHIVINMDVCVFVISVCIHVYVYLSEGELVSLFTDTVYQMNFDMKLSLYNV